jgi:hypothetical protein
MPMFSDASMQARKAAIALPIQAFALCSAIVAFNSVVAATAPVTAFPYDDLFFFDAIWRVVQGQHAGSDFYNPLGFGLFHVGAAAWGLFGAHRWILNLTSAIFNEVIIACSAGIISRRLSFSPRYTFLLCAVIAFEASAPSVYGWPIVSLGMSAFYNRISVAALIVLFVQCFARAPNEAKEERKFEILSCAILLNVMFLVKISALALGLAIIVGAYAFRFCQFSVRDLAVTGLLFVAMVVLDFWLTGMTPAGLLHDYWEAASVRTELATADGLWRIWTSWAALLFIPALALYGLSKKPRSVSVRQVILIIGTYFGLQVSLNITNTQPQTVFVAPACAAVLLAWKTPIEWPRKLWRLDESLPLVTFLFLIISQASASFVGLGLLIATEASIVTPVTVSAGGGIALPVLRAGLDSAHTTGFALAVNSGIELLKSSGLAHSRTTSLDYENPFSALFESPSPKGIPVLWDIGSTEPIDQPLSPGELVGDACVVMQPQHPTIIVLGSAEYVAAAAAPVLQDSFRLVAENDDWKIYRRKQGCSKEQSSFN